MVQSSSPIRLRLFFFLNKKTFNQSKDSNFNNYTTTKIDNRKVW